jgi:hypothetical protein
MKKDSFYSVAQAARLAEPRVVSAFHRGLALDHGYCSACAAKPAFTGLFSI